MAGFTQLLEVVASSTGQLEGLTGGPSQAQELLPYMAAWAGLQAGGAVGGELSACVLGHEEPLLVVHQAADRDAPASQQPS